MMRIKKAVAIPLVFVGLLGGTCEAGQVKATSKSAPTVKKYPVDDLLMLQTGGFMLCNWQDRANPDDKELLACRYKVSFSANNVFVGMLRKNDFSRSMAFDGLKHLFMQAGEDCGYRKTEAETETCLEVVKLHMHSVLEAID